MRVEVALAQAPIVAVFLFVEAAQRATRVRGKLLVVFMLVGIAVRVMSIRAMGACAQANRCDRYPGDRQD
jgi:hypothetical protein